MRHTIFLRGYGVCPHCSGHLRTIKSDMIILSCVDCGAFFRAVDDGQADSELEFEEVKVGND